MGPLRTEGTGEMGSDGGLVETLTQNGPRFFQFLAQRSSIRLEGPPLYLRHSSGRSVLAHVKRVYDLHGNRDKILAWMDHIVEEVQECRRAGLEASAKQT